MGGDQASFEDGATVVETMSRGSVLFMGLELACAPGALVARKETEALGRTAVRLVGERASTSGKQLVVDMCTGSGNLACAIATLAPDTVVHASDLTDGCVTVARENVRRLRLDERVTIHQGDLFAPLEGVVELHGNVDLVVCNPPYISTSKLEGDKATLLEREPREAFDGGPYGIAIHARVIKDALRFLKPGGVLAFEIGAGQARQVTALFGRSKSYEAVEAVSDEGGEVRVLISRRKNEA